MSQIVGIKTQTGASGRDATAGCTDPTLMLTRIDAGGQLID